MGLLGRRERRREEGEAVAVMTRWPDARGEGLMNGERRAIGPETVPERVRTVAREGMSTVKSSDNRNDGGEARAWGELMTRMGE